MHARFQLVAYFLCEVAQNAYDCATNQQINVVVPFDENVNSFIYYALDFNSAEIAALAGKQAVPIVNKSVFSSSVLVVSSEREEQQKIGDCLSFLDGLIAAHAERLEALRVHKKGLMQQLFPNPKAVGVRPICEILQR